MSATGVAKETVRITSELQYFTARYKTIHESNEFISKELVYS